MPDHTAAHVPGKAQPPEPRPHAAWRRLGERIRGAVTALNFRLFTLTAGMYVAAASFIGFESVALLLGYAALWPVAIPILIAVIVIVGTLVRRVRGRREAGDTDRGATGSCTKIVEGPTTASSCRSKP